MVTSCILALLGVASIAVWTGDLVTGNEVCAALGICGGQGVEPA